MGVVGRPHGVRGLVRLHNYTADAADLAAYSPLRDEAGRSWHVQWRADGIASLQQDGGSTAVDRDAAALLTNLRLYVERDRLKPVAKDEFYIADLVGMQAIDRFGTVLGQVHQVHDYGGGASLEIERDGAPVLLLPFNRACVPEIDLASRRLVLCPPFEIEAKPDSPA